MLWFALVLLNFWVGWKRLPPVLAAIAPSLLILLAAFSGDQQDPNDDGDTYGYVFAAASVAAWFLATTLARRRA